MRYMEAYNLYRQGKSIQEIAQIMGVSVKTVRKYISRARREVGEAPVQAPQSTREIEKIRAELRRLDEDISTVQHYVDNLNDKVDSIYRMLYGMIEELRKKIEELEERVSNAAITRISGVEVKDLASKVRAQRNVKSFVEGLIRRIAELDMAMNHYMSGTPTPKHDRYGTHLVYSIYVGGLYVSYKLDKQKKQIEDVYLASMVYPTDPLYEETYLRNLPKYAEKLVRWVSERLPKKVEEAVLELTEEQAKQVQQIYQEIVEYINRNLGK